MSSNTDNTAIKVSKLSKSYLLYDLPSHRLKQMVMGSLYKLLGKKPPSYFTEIPALKPIDFELEKGETIAIIGLNGAGKSTLLQLICGTLEPTTGKVEVSGRIAALLELGAGFDSELTGRENILFGGLVLGMTRNQILERFAAIEEFADIGDFIDYPVNTYSSGMYVRLAFSLAIHCDPEILVVDEALSVGDFMFQQKCNRFIKEKLGNTTKLLVTHDMGAVTNLATRVILINKGEKLYDGDPKTAIEKYQIVARYESQLVDKLGEPKARDNSDVQDTQSTEADNIHWINIRNDQVSGALQAKINKFDWKVGERRRYDICTDGDLVTVFFEINSNIDISDAIIGYQAQDRFGNVVFGNNNLGSHLKVDNFPKGSHRFKLTFRWPLVASGKYSLTLGVGRGDSALQHVIECWAHNIVILQSVPSEDLHGVFNVNISSLTVV